MTDAADVYREMVADILAERTTSRPHPDDAPRLSIVNCRALTSVEDLAPDEEIHLRAIWDHGGSTFAEALADDENSIEAADVVDEAGVVRYRLYGWNYGGGYLCLPDSATVVAYGSQHDVEHWTLDQRPLFAAMDRALRAGGHSFAQPLSFCWNKDECWDELADPQAAPRGSKRYLTERLRHVQER